MRRAVHFVGFRSIWDMRYQAAVRAFGEPDFLHQRWDMRAQRELAPEDVVVFAKGEADQAPSVINGNDAYYLAERG